MPSWSRSVPQLKFAALLVVALFCTWPLARPSSAQSDQALCFAQTEFCIEDATIATYFRTHGGTSLMGYPVSRLFRLNGRPTQLFQRVGLRLGDNGQVDPLDILDDNLLPLRHLQGVALPPVDQALLDQAPGAGEADFAQRTDDFLGATVPDVFNGQPIGFLQAYRSAGLDDDGRLLGLALFGWPTSAPVAEPTNVGVVYQRFERAIFRYTPASGLSEPLLLGDYVKSALTGRNLPADLAQDLQASPILRQYNPAAADGLHRPWDLPDSDLGAAFEPNATDPSVVLNPEGFSVGWPIDADSVVLSPAGYALATDASATLKQGETLAVSDGSSYGDFSLVVDATLTDGSPAGYSITVRQSESGERLTLLVDAGHRLATLYRAGGQSDAILWHWNPVSVLRPPPLANRWTLRASGPRLAAWANGTPLFDLDAAAPSRGSVWLASVTWGGPTRTVFGNLRLTAPS
jgi:hypothetical protein